MRVIFMGFQTWGYETLKALLGSKHSVPLVITHPASKHAYEMIWNDSVKELALTYDIPVIERQYANDEDIIKVVSDARPDIIVLSDWRTWLDSSVYNIPRFSGINIHDALLPKYGGFAPINWTIINGETQTGVTVHFLQDDIDLGDIVLQKKISIEFSDTATDIFHKTIRIIPGLTLEALDLIESRQVKPIPQDRNQATFFHKRSARDSLIDWKQSNIDIYNLIRAQSDPYPNAYTYYKNKKLMLKKASLPDKSYCGTPGRVFCRVDSGVVVVCGSYTANSKQGIILEYAQEEGGDIIEANRYFDRMGSYLSETVR